MTVENMPYEGGIRITHTQADCDGMTNVDRVLIKRRKTGGTLFDVIGTVLVEEMDDLDFQMMDYFALPGQSYDYLTIPQIEGADQLGRSGTATCSFSGWAIGDATAHYLCALNAELEFERVYAVTFVQTFHGRYPNAIVNGETNYFKGRASGLFLPRDASGEFTLEGYRAYKDGVLDFLTNERAKALRSGEGQAWLIMVDDTIKEERSDYLGANKIIFSWTQIGDVPTDGNLVVTI